MLKTDGIDRHENFSCDPNWASFCPLTASVF